MTHDFTTLPDGRATLTLRSHRLAVGIVFSILGALGAALIFANPVCGIIGAVMLIAGLIATVSAILVRRRLGPATLTLSHFPVGLGESFEVAYEQAVRTMHEIEAVTITLVCTESARYRSGKHTRTVTHKAFEEKQTLLESGTATPEAPLASAATFEIPRTAMHSFNASNNSVRWTLALRAAIARVPDYTAECNLTVTPRAVNAAGAVPHAGGLDRESEEMDEPEGNGRSRGESASDRERTENL